MAGRAKEPLNTDMGHQLLEHRGAFGIGNAVEVLTGSFQIDDISDDRVGCRLLVGGVGPGFAPDGEVRPSLAVFGAGNRGVGTHVLGEGLLKPQIVPPLRGNEVAEPHVSHLVEDGVGATCKLRSSSWAAMDVVLGEGHQTRILHRTKVVFRHENLVVLTPWVGVAKGAMVEGQTLLGDLEDLLMVDVLGQRGTSQDTQRNRFGAVTRVPLVLEPDVGAGSNGGEISRHPRGEGEIVQEAIFLLPNVFVNLIGGDPPVARGDDVKVDVGFEIGLFEH